jgi:hypothetical protein
VNVASVANTFSFCNAAGPLGLMYDVWDINFNTVYPSQVITHPNATATGTACLN